MAALETLRPTQLTVGCYQVQQKKEVTMRTRSRGALRRLMRGHRIETIAGPGGVLYITDHHHWARAWCELGLRRAPVIVLADLGKLRMDKFWRKMLALGHVHPYDENGKRLGISALPESVSAMRDDPYRSLAAFARQAGAYRKPGNAYGDFSWAAFFRKHVQEDLRSVSGFAWGLSQACRLARGSKARRLPGYIGE
jgi:hypothetical protein